LEDQITADGIMRPVLVTGAAGFIGSHLTDRLLNFGMEVVGFDNLSSGDIANLAYAMQSPHFHFVRGDLLDTDVTARALAGSELVFHLAADPEVRAGAQNPDAQFKQNLQATHNLLEAIRKRSTPTRLVFASTSTIYGEATLIPTPEDYGPLLPISTYGATKLGCEALAASYSQLLPFRVVIFRFANVVGARARHGVLYDFIMELQNNPHRLEVLGDGTQTKSYLHVDDCISAFLLALDDRFWTRPVEVYNIGSEDQTNVLTIAQIVKDAMRLGGATVSVTAKPGERAWPGDVRTMRLDISKIKGQGWKPRRNSDEAIRTATSELVHELSKQTGRNERERRTG
jgi:UDP-glucose 4-epimerase